MTGIVMEDLHHDDHRYKMAKKLMFAHWHHPQHRKVILKHIWFITNNTPGGQLHGARYNAYTNLVAMASGKPNEYLFHSTQRACPIGNHHNNTHLRNKSDCYMCPIIKNSFSLKHAKATGLFGPGIYATDHAAKADGYYKDTHGNRTRCVLLSIVAAGNTEYRYGSNPLPPSLGFHSVPGGTVLGNGSLLKYPETVVYREDAICPFILIVYDLGAPDSVYHLHGH
ncbi:hypothetical protein B0H16DRAFT_1716637 [Mycena metata]|uniref:Poly [ADP-ribose] polymerase n=1 Tax=Mycena metata TaxID=1033252 RepID=A0AAD7JPJ4_9AGAR|nr:hypothetical protein B0H16DRAFT_1716637 [Mycena metata]